MSNATTAKPVICPKCHIYIADPGITTLHETLDGPVGVIICKVCFLNEQFIEMTGDTNVWPTYPEPLPLLPEVKALLKRN